MNIVKADLDWWFEVAPTLEWRWAKTYADFAPHWYLLRDKTRLSLEEYHRALRVIWTFGETEKFYRKVNVALRSPDGEKKWFSIGMDTSNALINMAGTERVYGEQDAPWTGLVRFTEFDEIASVYEPVPRAFQIPVYKHVMGERAVPSLLDVGAGTGVALDLGMTPRDQPDRYRAVDPSHGMLNRLVYGHQWVKDVWPVTAEEYLRENDGRTFDTVVALFGVGSYLTPEDLEGLSELAETMFCVMHHKPSAVPRYGSLPTHAKASRMAAAAITGAEVGIIGDYQIVTVRR